MTDTVTENRIEAVLEGDAIAKITLGPEARTAIMREQIRKLHESLRLVEAAEEALPQFDRPEARTAIEELGAALDAAAAAATVLWHLAPDGLASEEI